MVTFLNAAFNRLEEIIIGLLLTCMVTVTFTQVVLRYVFNGGYVWALELTTYLFAWMVLLGISYGVRVNAHIGVDALVKLFPDIWQRSFTIIAALLGITYSVLIFIGGWHYVTLIYDIGIESEDLPIPQWIPYLIIPLSMVLLCLRFVQVIVNVLRGQQTTLLADEAHDAIAEHMEHDVRKTA